jgi:NAD-dependent dihydropyrimidine dehydrogenase PreA subunit
MEAMGMTFVIAEPCTDVMDRACVGVCPVACINFEEGKDRKLYIDPDECIDCGACEPICPVEAIYSEYDLPSEWEPYAEVDALWYQNKTAARAMVNELKEKG